MSKHREFILAIEKALLPNALLAEGLTDLTQPHLHVDTGVTLHNVLMSSFEELGILARRSHVEERDTWLHPIPYIVFTRMFDGVEKFFVYRRGKGVGEEKLLGNLSIGIGGHIDHHSISTSLKLNPPNMAKIHVEISPSDMIVTGTQAEIIEELQGLYVSLTGNTLTNTELLGECDFLEGVSFTHSLYDTSNLVGTTHLGLIAKVPFGDKQIDLVCKEPFLQTLGWMTLEEIRAYEVANLCACENWTNILLDHYTQPQ